MHIKRTLWVIFSLLSLIFVSSVSAGGGLVSINVTSYDGITITDLKPGLPYIVRPTAYADDSYKKFCAGCPIKIKFENPQSSDIVNASSEKTDENGTMYAKVVSYIPGPRMVYAEVVLPDGKTYTSSKAILNYLGKSEGQPNTIVIQKNTTSPQEKPNFNTETVKSSPIASPTNSLNKEEDNKKVEELNRKVENLENQLEESKRKQSALESRLNQVLNWIKSIFPFFK